MHKCAAVERVFPQKSFDQNIWSSERGKNLKRKATVSPTMNCENLTEEESLVDTEGMSAKSTRILIY